MFSKLIEKKQNQSDEEYYIEILTHIRKLKNGF